MILSGSDFSRGSDAALRLAAAWARRTSQRLACVHVLEPPADGLPAAAREILLAELALQLRRAGADEADARLDEGDAADRLAPRADTTIVVGSEGGSATLLRRAGHVPRALVQALPPGARVLVAPLGWSPAPTRRRRNASPRPAPKRLAERVLVACSLRGDAADAARVALAARLVAGSDTSELHLAHVVDVSAARHHALPARDAVRDATEAGVRGAQERLRDLASDVPLELVARRDVRLHVVRQGPVERDLAGLARSQAIDLIVAGPGDVAARLVGFAGSPLLVAER